MTSSDQQYGCCEVTALTDGPRRRSCSFGISLVCHSAVISRSEFADLSLTHPLSGFSKTHQWDGSASPCRHGHRAGDDKLHDSREAWLDDTWPLWGFTWRLLIMFVCTYSGAEGEWRVGDHGPRGDGGQTEQDAQQPDHDLNDLRTQTETQHEQRWKIMQILKFLLKHHQTEKQHQRWPVCRLRAACGVTGHRRLLAASLNLYYYNKIWSMCVFL